MLLPVQVRSLPVECRRNLRPFTERRFAAALPGGVGEELGGAFRKPQAGIRDDRPDAREAAPLEMLKEWAPTVLLGVLADAKNLSCQRQNWDRTAEGARSLAWVRPTRRPALSTEKSMLACVIVVAFSATASAVSAFFAWHAETGSFHCRIDRTSHGKTRPKRSLGRARDIHHTSRSVVSVRPLCLPL
jgi:hypothetical protein